jgi:hypothetical protein
VRHAAGDVVFVKAFIVGNGLGEVLDAALRLFGESAAPESHAAPRDIVQKSFGLKISILNNIAQDLNSSKRFSLFSAFFRVFLRFRRFSRAFSSLWGLTNHSFTDILMRKQQPHGRLSR